MTRLTRRGRNVITALILLALTMGAAFWIMMQAQQDALSRQHLNNVTKVQLRHIEQQIQEDDGPQDGSTDCWSNCPTQ